MTNRITQTSFGGSPFPKRIEDDPRFNGWDRALPRLWYLDQRQATRLDAESLYGASQYARFYNRTQFTTLAEPNEVGIIGVWGHYRESITAINPPVQTAAKHVGLHRGHAMLLAEPDQSVVLIRPSGGPVNPIVHPILGASIGEGADAISGDLAFRFTGSIVGLEEGQIDFLEMEDWGTIAGVKARRIGGSDTALNFTVNDEPVLRYDMALTLEGQWYEFPPEDIIFTDVLDIAQVVRLQLLDTVGALPTEIHIEMTFLHADDPTPEALPLAIMALEPVAYWKLNETTGTDALDFTGNGHQGTYSGDVELSGEPGPGSLHAKFEFSEDPAMRGLVTIPDHPDLAPYGHGLTVMMLYKTPNPTDLQYLLTKDLDDETNTEWEVSLGNGGAQFGPSVVVDGMQEDQWQLLIGRIEDAETSADWEGFVDTATTYPYLSDNNPFTLIQTGASLALGGFTHNMDYGANGGMAHVAIWNVRLGDVDLQTIVDAAIADGWFEEEFVPTPDEGEPQISLDLDGLTTVLSSIVRYDPVLEQDIAYYIAGEWNNDTPSSLLFASVGPSGVAQVGTAFPIDPHRRSYDFFFNAEGNMVLVSGAFWYPDPEDEEVYENPVIISIIDISDLDNVVELDVLQVPDPINDACYYAFDATTGMLAIVGGLITVYDCSGDSITEVMTGEVDEEEDEFGYSGSGSDASWIGDTIYRLASSQITVIDMTDVEAPTAKQFTFDLDSEFLAFLGVIPGFILASREDYSGESTEYTVVAFDMSDLTGPAAPVTYSTVGNFLSWNMMRMNGGIASNGYVDGDGSAYIVSYDYGTGDAAWYLLDTAELPTTTATEGADITTPGDWYPNRSFVLQGETHSAMFWENEAAFILNVTEGIPPQRPEFPEPLGLDLPVIIDFRSGIPAEFVSAVNSSEETDGLAPIGIDGDYLAQTILLSLAPGQFEPNSPMTMMMCFKNVQGAADQPTWNSFLLGSNNDAFTDSYVQVATSSGVSFDFSRPYEDGYENANPTEDFTPSIDSGDFITLVFMWDGYESFVAIKLDHATDTGEITTDYTTGYGTIEGGSAPWPGTGTWDLTSDSVTISQYFAPADSRVLGFFLQDAMLDEGEILDVAGLWGYEGTLPEPPSTLALTEAIMALSPSGYWAFNDGTLNEFDQAIFPDSTFATGEGYTDSTPDALVDIAGIEGMDGRMYATASAGNTIRIPTNPAWSPADSGGTTIFAIVNVPVDDVCQVINWTDAGAGDGGGYFLNVGNIPGDGGPAVSINALTPMSVPYGGGAVEGISPDLTATNNWIPFMIVIPQNPDGIEIFFEGIGTPSAYQDHDFLATSDPYNPLQMIQGALGPCGIAHLAVWDELLGSGDYDYLIEQAIEDGWNFNLPL